MHEIVNTLFFRHSANTSSLLGLRVDVVIGLQAQGKRGRWSVRGASFVSIQDPFDRVTWTGANYADLPAECPSALCIALGAPLPAPAPATALFLKAGPRGAWIV
jgi:hypothetical protein